MGKTNEWVPIGWEMPAPGPLVWVHAKIEGLTVARSHGMYFETFKRGLLYPQDVLAWRYVEEPEPYEPKDKSGEIAFRIRETVYKAMNRAGMKEEWGFSADEFEEALKKISGGAYGSHDRGTKKETEGTPETV